MVGIVILPMLISMIGMMLIGMDSVPVGGKEDQVGILYLVSIRLLEDTGNLLNVTPSSDAQDIILDHVFLLLRI